MKRVSKLLLIIMSIITVFSCVAVPGSAEFQVKNLDGREFAPAVENQGEKDNCLYYAILSTAGSYAKKCYNVSDKTAGFNENRLEKEVGISDIHNFGEILYKCTECYLSHSFSITSVELLTGRGRRYLQEKIKENGAIVAAIALPDSENCLFDEKYYSSEYNSFYCEPEYQSSKKSHAVSIVGWDDVYEWCAETEHGLPGAWLCKNSYGSDYGDEGYFWLPYEYGLLYSAALEVSRTGWFDTIHKANELNPGNGYIYAVNIRAFRNTTEDVTVKVGDNVAFSGEVSLKNGCNFIKLDKPVKADAVSVSGENISCSPDTVVCYISVFGINFADIRIPEKDEAWLERVYALDIDINPRIYRASSTNKVNRIAHHKMTYSSINNCYYITPADGYYFDEETLINTLEGFDDGYDILDWYDNYGEEFMWFSFNEDWEYIENFTIKMAVDADYHRLKDQNGNWVKMISFDKGEDGRGRIKIVGSGIGGGQIESVNIITDESSLLKYVILSFDNGSEFVLNGNNQFFGFSYYSDGEFFNKIDSVNELEEYYLKMNLKRFSFDEDFEILVNGVNADESIVYKTRSEIGIKIEIPDIELKPAERRTLFRDIINKLLTLFR